MMDNLKKLGGLFAGIVRDSEGFGERWRTIPLARQAYTLMRDSLPMRVKGELTPYTRIVLLNKMMDCMPERDCARFLKEVKEYQLTLFPLISDGDIAEDMDIDGFEGNPEKYVRAYSVEEHEKSLQRTLDYLDPEISMEEWCRKYGICLKFDPVERSQEWEDCICDVEAECAVKLKNEIKGMGFCFLYWSTKKAVLAKYGIEWRSPGLMNPRVMFD